ncbi:MAG: hypothetical protein U0791_25945 [Gemmataceae bacterium]
MPIPQFVTAMAHWLFLPDDALDDLAILSKLPVEGIAAFRVFLNGTEYRPKFNFYVQAAELLDISDESSAKLCTFVNYVQSQASRLSRSGSEVVAELDRFLERRAKDDSTRERASALLRTLRDHRPVLVELFEPVEEDEVAEKERDLGTGPLPHLHTFRTYCDIRPVYDSKGDSIVSHLPIVTLHLVFHQAFSDEYREHVVQLTEDNVSEIRSQLDRLDKKLGVLDRSHPETRKEDRQ